MGESENKANWAELGKWQYGFSQKRGRTKSNRVNNGCLGRPPAMYKDRILNFTLRIRWSARDTYKIPCVIVFTSATTVQLVVA